VGTGGQLWRRRSVDEPSREGRWSARKKADAVVRLLRGKPRRAFPGAAGGGASLAGMARSSGPAASRGLKARPLQAEDRKLKDTEQRIGELTMELEVWRAAARKGA
jgi:hypothetical protein